MIEMMMTMTKTKEKGVMKKGKTAEKSSAV